MVVSVVHTVAMSHNAAHNLRVRPPRKRRAGAPLADRVKQGEPREAPKQAA